MKDVSKHGLGSEVVFRSLSFGFFSSLAFVISQRRQ